MSTNVKPLHDQMIAHVEKLEFITEVVRDWAADPGLIDAWTEKTITRVFAGLEIILAEASIALRDIAERGPKHKEGTA